MRVRKVWIVQLHGGTGADSFLRMDTQVYEDLDELFRSFAPCTIEVDDSRTSYLIRRGDGERPFKEGTNYSEHLCYAARMVDYRQAITP